MLAVNREKTKLRSCIVNIKFIHFIIFIIALKFKSEGGQHYLQSIFESCILKACFASKLIIFPHLINTFIVLVHFTGGLSVTDAIPRSIKEAN